MTMANEKRAFRGEWQELCRLPEYCLFEEFPFQVSELEGELFELGLGAYARIWEIRVLPPGLPKNVLYVAVVYWAISDTAARVVDGKLPFAALGGNRKAWRSRPSPPSTLLLPGVRNATCGELYKAALRAKSGIPERATYGFDGKFEYKVVSAMGVSYYFCDRGKNDLEMPFAIRIHFPLKSLLL